VRPHARRESSRTPSRRAPGSTPLSLRDPKNSTSASSGRTTRGQSRKTLSAIPADAVPRSALGGDVRGDLKPCRARVCQERRSRALGPRHPDRYRWCTSRRSRQRGSAAYPARHATDAVGAPTHRPEGARDNQHGQTTHCYLHCRRPPPAYYPDAERDRDAVVTRRTQMRPNTIHGLARPISSRATIRRSPVRCLCRAPGLLRATDDRRLRCSYHVVV